MESPDSRCLLTQYVPTMIRKMKQTDVFISFHTEREIPALKLKRLYDSEPWWPERSIEDLRLMLNRYPAVGAWNGEELVGFARAVTDSRFRAYIEDDVA